jgi:small subunit ribosomal protein S2
MSRFPFRAEQLQKTVRFKPEWGPGLQRGCTPFYVDMWKKGVLETPLGLEPTDYPLFGHMQNLVDPIDLISIDELFECGAHLGQKASDYNKSMRPYIYGERRDYHVIDLHYTLASVRTIGRLFQYVILSGGQILWVNYERSQTDLLRHFASKCRQPYMYDRWRPGLFTNFKEVLTNVQLSKKINIPPNLADRKDLKRQVEWRREAIHAFAQSPSLPSLVFFMNSRKTKNQAFEAQQVQLPTISILDTDCSAESINYVIPLNDDNRKAVSLVCNALCESIESALNYSERMRKVHGVTFERWVSEY